MLPCTPVDRRWSYQEAQVDACQCLKRTALIKSFSLAQPGVQSESTAESSRFFLDAYTKTNKQKETPLLFLNTQVGIKVCLTLDSACQLEAQCSPQGACD